MNLKLSRAKLESLVDDLVQKTLEPCKTALKDAELSVTDIEVILVGGQTRIPKVQGKISSIRNQKKMLIQTKLHVQPYKLVYWVVT